MTRVEVHLEFEVQEDVEIDEKNLESCVIDALDDYAFTNLPDGVGSLSVDVEVHSTEEVF